MTLTEQLIELIESKSIKNEDITVTSWFVLDAMANIAAGRSTEPGRILNRWFLDEPAKHFTHGTLVGWLDAYPGSG